MMPRVDLDLMSVALELSGDKSDGQAARIYEALIAAQRPLEAALVTIRSSIPGYLKQKMTAEEFALIVIGAADSAMVNKALEKGR
jgi:hypothetical protein